MRNKSDSPVTRKWTDAEIQYLFTAIEGRTRLKEIAKTLDRTEQSIRSMATRLGVKVGRQVGHFTKAKESAATAYSVWSTNEIETLNKLWFENLSIDDIAAQLGRTRAGVQYMRKRCNLPRRNAASGTPEEMAEMFKNGHTLREIGQKFGISAPTVLKSIKAFVPTSRKLSDDDISVIEERHQDGCTLRCIARRIGRSHEAVRNYIQLVGLDEIETDADSLVLDLKQHGLTPDQIARKLEYPVMTVRTVLRRLEGGHNAR